MKSNKYFVALSFICIILYSCSQNSSERQQPQIVKKDQDLKLMYVNFENLSLNRHPIPIKNRDSLRANLITFGEYFNRHALITDQLSRMQSDTILPPLQRNDSIVHIHANLEELNDHAFVTALTVCGYQSHLEDVEFFLGNSDISGPKVLDYSLPVGLLKWSNNVAQDFISTGDDAGNVQGRSWGSGVLITDNLFLTAGHCLDIYPNEYFSAITPRKNGKAIDGYEMIKYMCVIFNYQKSAVTHLIHGDTAAFEIDSLMEYREKGLDYAILRLKPDKNGNLPGKLFNRINIAPASYAPKNQESIFIIQQANGDLKKVGSGHVSNITTVKIFYNDLDTDPGSSGSPVIDCKSGFIIGVHSDGNCSETAGSNFCTRIDYIRPFSKIIKALK